MRNLTYFFGLLAMFFSLPLSAQMEIDGQVLYGNEWINYDQTYFKIFVDADGIYQISGAELTAGGVDLNDFQGSELQLFNLGKEVHIQVSTDGNFGPNDSFKFIGYRNDGELDKQLYTDVNNVIQADSLQLNPKYSLFSDNAAYYLTWSPGEHLRISEEDNILDETLEAEDFYLHEEEIIFSEFHFKPTYNGVDKVRLSDFDLCEGFGSVLLSSQVMRIKTSERKTGTEFNPKLTLRLAANSTNHQLEVSASSTVIYEDAFANYTVKQLDIDFDPALLKNNTNIRVKGLLSSDSYSVAYVTMTYPRKIVFPDTLNYDFFSRAGEESRYYELDNFIGTSDPLYYYDVERNTVKEITLDGDKRKFVVSENQDKKKIKLVSPGGFSTIKSIERTEFIDFKTVNPEFLIITSERLLDEEYNGENMIDTYADYRRSEKGGSYDVYIALSEQLVDQFAYGIERNPLSGRNFINYINNHWTNQKFLFTIGKGVEYSVYRTEEDLNNPLIPYMHVPTYGVPGSDNLLYGKKGISAPLVPTGRIAARDAEDIRTYLDKILAHDSTLEADYTPEDIQWTKRIIHLSGGDAVIQNQIFNWLGEMKKVIEDDMFGAEVTTFRKSSTDNLQSADSEMILNAINDGVSIITFFGHSAVGTFDFSLEAASEYDNTGRYPLLISLGCHSGNIFAGSSGLGLSEEFVFEPERGSIAFLASTSTAYIGPQFVTGRTFYRNISQEFYGKPIGEALKSYFDENANNRTLSVRSLNQQMTYHGDPALRFIDYDAPDYLVDRSSVAISPKVITTSDEAYELSFDVINAGKSITDSIEIKITHTIPDGTSRDYFVDIPTPPFKQSVQLTIENPGLTALGKNTIDIVVDNSERITEMPSPEGEDNNTLSYILGNEGFEYFIESNIAKPVAPSEFSIVTAPQVTLVAATTNLFSESTSYLMQIDTSALFENPLEEAMITRSGGKIDWSPSIMLEDELVYYWRVSPDDLDSNYIWRESSFIALIDESQGWNQSHFYQFNKDEFDDIQLPRHEQLQFDTNGFFISLQNKLFDPNNNACFQFNFEQCASSVSPWNFMNNGGLAVAILDEISGNGWVNNGGDFGSISTNNFASFRVFGFETQTTEERANVINILENEIPEGAYVFVWSAMKFDDNDIKVEEWRADTVSLGTSILDVLESEGAGLTNEFEQNGTVPYNFIYQKGRKIFGENVGTNIYEQVVTTVFIPVKDTEGTVLSTTIGPSVSWGHLTWELDDYSDVDTFGLSIIGIEELGGKEEVIDVLTDKFSYDLSEISASQYKYMRLEFHAKDEIERTPPQLEHWRVYYNEYPEAIFNPEAHYVFNSDTLEQGEFLNFSVNVENITSTPMDELLVHYTIIDAENNEELIVRQEDKINATGSINIAFDYSTAPLLGDYLFIVEFNPNFDQKEKFIFNNLGIRNFHVKGSRLNPLLDVRFDNKRIEDGDIVSPTPEISIELFDENKFLYNDNPENFQQAILLENGSRIDYEFPDNALSFFPGTEDNNNHAQMLLRPAKLEPGNYTFVAQAKNAAGIFSGDHEYSVDFRIVANSCVESLYNYPNPFTTSTKIEYTLSGVSEPESMQLEIYDGAGKVVRRISNLGTGASFIGTEKLLFEWDGTNEGGTDLENGLYFYRLVVNDLNNNKSFRNCGSDLDVILSGKIIKMQ